MLVVWAGPHTCSHTHTYTHTHTHTHTTYTRTHTQHAHTHTHTHTHACTSMHTHRKCFIQFCHQIPAHFANQHRSSHFYYRNDIIGQFDQKFQLLTAVCHNLEEYLAQARSALQGSTVDCGIALLPYGRKILWEKTLANSKLNFI